jgi:mono/diheme cytochrome c family protein
MLTRAEGAKSANILWATGLGRRPTGAGMKNGSMVLLSLVLLFPLGLAAQNGGSTPASGSDTVTLGRRLFQQNCSICHTQATLTNPMYGPSLYRDIVNGKEDAMRDYIAKGSSKMPGFRYGLKASDSGAIVEYLKTVPKPAPRGPIKGEGPVD